MLNSNNNESMLDMFIFETTGLIEQLEQTILSSENACSFSEDAINEIFRVMHTIKGSAAMMLFHNISSLAHSLEDIFFCLREEKPENIDCSRLSDLIFDGIDFIKVEIQKIQNGDEADGDSTDLIQSLHQFLSVLKQNDNKAFKARIFFEEGCEMENIRAYTVINDLKEITDEFYYIPKEIIDDDSTVEIIREKGFTIYLKTNLEYKEIHEFFMKTIFLRDLEIIQLDTVEEYDNHWRNLEEKRESAFTGVSLLQEGKSEKHREKELHSSGHQSIISVNVNKLDKLMDLVGEMVIAEAMVTQNPDLKGLQLDNFQKAARQLHKITSDLQDMVMSIRMVPLTNTFHKMHRIVRDMKKKLGKEVQLNIIGEETEVDKNIIEHISDPLMHLVRNAIDHGIETSEERMAHGKSTTGYIVLEAKNAGSDVLVTIKDDGKGLNKDKILERARKNGLLFKPENELTDKEIYSLIFYPGFSTKDNVTEFSGRGVGMDVVTKNIEAVGGSVSVDSIAGTGTTVTLKIPLTLAIIDGMNIGVGNGRYTLPTISIKESFRPKEQDVIVDPANQEMIMVRGQCYPIIRLHQLYNVKTSITKIHEGILIMVEDDNNGACIFADELLGQQQVVVKTLPEYIKKMKHIDSLAGCTLLGDGSISLILDVARLIQI